MLIGLADHVMGTTEQYRMQQFLHAIARVDHTRHRIFRLADVCRCLQWQHDDCDRVAQRLEKDGLLNRLPDGEAILTSAGLKRAEGESRS